MAPEGWTIQGNPPAATVLKFKAQAGAELIGRHILFNRGLGHGWCRGEVIEQNSKGTYKVDGEPVNFIVAYYNDPQLQACIEA